MGKSRTPYLNQYQRDKYDRFGVLLPKGSKARLQEYAQQHGASLNAVIIAAIEAYTGVVLNDD